jgi:hypothetical protein
MMNKIKPASKKGTRKNASVKHLKPETAATSSSATSGKTKENATVYFR